MQIALLFLLPPPAILGSKRGCISAIDSTGERSGLQTHIATTENVSLYIRMNC